MDNVFSSDIEDIRKVLIETEIRGKHASGISWYDGTQINTIKKSVPISELLEEFDLNQIVNDGNIRMIAHIRYSTSDILYNQPINVPNNDFVFAHNGVVTQTDPSKWKETYGYDCLTKNDSELLCQSIYETGSVDPSFDKVSYSMVFLDCFGNLHHGRNNLRPQWLYESGNKLIVASTKDILIRSGLDESSISKVLYDSQYIDDSVVDKQRRTFDSKKRSIYSVL